MPEDISNQKRKAELPAILSSCCGLIGEITITDSSVIVLFAALLGAGDMLTLFSTSVLPFIRGLMIMPMAFAVARLGIRRLVLGSCFIGAAAYFAAASSPWADGFQIPFLLTALVVFALAMTGFVAGWFPLLDTLLTRERRILVLGRMRFCHQLSAVLFLVLVSFFIGKTPPIGHLQAVLFLAACFFTGRGVCISRIPEFSETKAERGTLLTGLKEALLNGPLMKFSAYQFVLNVSCFGIFPLSMLLLKNALKAPDNVTVFISGFSLAGMLLGYWLLPRLAARLGSRRSFMLMHLLLLVPNIGLLFAGEGKPTTYMAVTALLALTSFSMASVSILGSSAMMELSAPGNKTMSMAVCNSLYYSGIGLSRIGASLLLGKALFPTAWHFLGRTLTPYHAVFMIFALLNILAYPLQIWCFGKTSRQP